MFDRVVRTCLAKDPEDRWQSSRDVGRELQWVIEGGSQPQKLVLGPGGSQRASWRQEGMRLGLAGLVVGGIIAGAAVWRPAGLLASRAGPAAW